MPQRETSVLYRSKLFCQKLFCKSSFAKLFWKALLESSFAKLFHKSSSLSPTSKTTAMSSTPTALVPTPSWFEPEVDEVIRDAPTPVETKEEELFSLVATLETETRFAGRTLHVQRTDEERQQLTIQLEHAKRMIAHWTEVSAGLKAEMVFEDTLRQQARKRRSPETLTVPKLETIPPPSIPSLLETVPIVDPKRRPGQRGPDKKPRKGSKAWKEMQETGSC